MAENYKPKHIQAGRVVVRHVECPNCYHLMHPEESDGFRCLNERCRLFDVRYRIIKTLATMERE